jgi:hypothetical protein
VGIFPVESALVLRSEIASTKFDDPDANGQGSTLMAIHLEFVR